MRGTLRVAAGILGLLAIAAAPPDERAVLEVVLNGRVVGDRVVVLTADGDVLVPAELLRAEELGSLVSGGRDPVSLRSLAPRLSFAIDAPGARLELNVDPKLLPGSRVDLGRRPPPGLERIAAPSLLANYALRLLDADASGAPELELPWELVGRVGPVAGLSDFEFSDLDGLVRLTSRLVWDDVDAARRVTLGDFVAATPVLGSQLALGGVSIARDFGLQPYLVTSPEPSVAGVLQTPSDVEVYVNGGLVQRLQLPAGEFDLRNLPVRIGAGDVRVLIRDAYGRTRELDLAFYATSRLLKRGVQQYAYQLGVRREHLGETSFDYGDPALLAFHRLGVSDAFTAGLQAELDPDVANLGCELGVGLRRLGELDLALAGSLAGGRSAGALSLGWAWRGGPISTGLAAQLYGDGYATVAQPGRVPRPRLAASLGISASLGWQGGVSLFLSHERPRDRDDRTRVALHYVRSLTPRLALDLGGGLAYDAKLRSDVSLGLTLFFGRRGTASLRSRRSDDALAAGLAAQWRPPLGTGFGLDLDVSASDLELASDPDARARAEYRSDFGVASAEYRHLVQRHGYLAQWAGSLVATEGRLRAGRPVADGFALIRVSDLPDVLVSYNNEPMGRTDERGELLVPELRSQLHNRLSIEPRQVPFGYRIGKTARSITVPFRGGGLVDFGVSRLRAYEGRLVVVDDAGARPAQYGRLELERDGETLQVPLGSGGALYLEGIEPGAYPARIVHEGKTCEFRLELPDRREPIADVGEVACAR